MSRPGPADHPAVSHKIVHNYETLSSMFENAGFKVNLLEYCDENGEFHYNEWDEKKGFIFRTNIINGKGKANRQMNT